MVAGEFRWFNQWCLDGVHSKHGELRWFTEQPSEVVLFVSQVPLYWRTWTIHRAATRPGFQRSISGSWEGLLRSSEWPRSASVTWQLKSWMKQPECCQTCQLAKIGNHGFKLVFLEIIMTIITLYRSLRLWSFFSNTNGSNGFFHYQPGGFSSLQHLIVGMVYGRLNGLSLFMVFDTTQMINGKLGQMIIHASKWGI